MSTTDRLNAIIIDRLGVEEDKITPTAHLQNDLGADSLDAVELVMAVEEEFDVEIPDDAAEKMETVGDLINYIDASSK